MRARFHLRRLLPLLAALALLPFRGDATNANIQCCTMATSFATSMFGGGTADETYFSVPAVPGNLMLLLGNSTSMLDLAGPLPGWITPTGPQSYCVTFDGVSNPEIIPASTAAFDSGWSTTVMTDSPPWAPAPHGTCTPGSGTCLFTPSSLYVYPLTSRTGAAPFTGKVGPGAGADLRPGLGDPTGSWGSDRANRSGLYAKEYTASLDACSINVPGTNYSRMVNNGIVQACRSCFDNAAAVGKAAYFSFVDQATCPLKHNGPDCSTGTPLPTAILSGSLLNAHPPKFVVARKLVKQMAKIDPANPTFLDATRMGLAMLDPNKQSTAGRNGYLSGDGSKIVVPLGPSCNNAALSAPMVQARQLLVNAINDPGTGGGTPVLAQVPFYNGKTSAPVNAQLAEGLYYVGQYFSNYPNATASNMDVYTKLFSSWGSQTNWTNADMNETNPGTMNAPWAANADQHSVCWPCQKSAVLVVSDGTPNNDNNVPNAGVNLAAHYGTDPSTTRSGALVGDFINWRGFVDCLPSGTAPNNDVGCGTDPPQGGTGSVQNQLHKIAAFLWAPSVSGVGDLRNDASPTDMTAPGTKQNLRTYTIGVGTIASGLTEITDVRARLLTKTAQLGMGLFQNLDPLLPTIPVQSQLDNALTALSTSLEANSTNVTANATTFAMAAAAPLQTGSSAQVLVPRFRPMVSPQWEGHLFRFKLWNEFAQGCFTGNPVTSGCNGVYVTDSAGSLVAEDPNTGEFLKGTFNAAGQVVPASGNTPATPVWDAGAILSTPGTSAWRSASDANVTNDYSTNATARKIYTVLSDGSGQYPANSALVPFAVGNVATLKDYLGLDANYCTKLYQRMGVYGAAGWNVNDMSKCARQVIFYTRGWDVLDEDRDGCGGPDNSDVNVCTGGEQRDRQNDNRNPQLFWKLGDIFHSTPVFVNPPATEMVCDLALDPQCVSTIHSPSALSSSPQTPIASYNVAGVGTVDAYEQYRRDKAGRARVALVGANDGMLHAFDAGSATTDGTGAELWAFIPPDLLPKLKNALLGHEYFVDGNTMVRDIWVDGVDASGAIGSKNNVKESGEFRTVAVISERAGGSEYLGLDVTNPTDPKFRWIYPQPCSSDASGIGQSWSSFAPRPPPIGPVKIRNTGAAYGTRQFEERWVVMLNGGFDASLTRGRGVWMLDAWSGQTLWRFTSSDFSDPGKLNGKGGMFPVPGAVALLDIGTGMQPNLESDGFFDTAVWADMGGQIFVGRFNVPGEQDASGLMSNWSAARAFEEQRQGDDSQMVGARSEFYLMPTNTLDPATGFIHTYVGSGNRENLLATGLECGPDNVMGCMQAGCNTDVTTRYDFGTCAYQVKVHATNGTMRQVAGDFSNTCTVNPFTCSQVNIDFNVQTVCGQTQWKPPGGAYHAALSCDNTTVPGSWTCPTQLKLLGGKKAPGTELNDPGTHSRFYGIWSYGGARVFDERVWSSAKTFDGNRLTDVTATGCLGTAGGNCQVADVTYARVNSAGAISCTQGSNCSAGTYDPGWMYVYGYSCPMGSCSGSSTWSDEKTGSTATVQAGCVAWNTMRPTGVLAGAGTTCSATSGLTTNYSYLADFITGAPSTTCGYSTTTSSNLVRAKQRPAVAAPSVPMQIVARSGGALVSYSVAQIDPGAQTQNQQVGTTTESNQMIYWLEVPRDLHACRHDPTKGAACQ